MLAGRVRISHLEYLSSLQPFALRHYVPGWGSNPLPSTISVLRRNFYSVTFSCWHLQNLVVTVGLEPTINTVWRWCISHYATLPYVNTLHEHELTCLLALTLSVKDPKDRVCLHMVGPPGLEPGIGRLKVCCDNHFTTIPYWSLATDSNCHLIG